MASQRAVPTGELPDDAPIPVEPLDVPAAPPLPTLDEEEGVLDDGVLLVEGGVAAPAPPDVPVAELPLVLVPELPDDAPLLDDGLLVDCAHPAASAMTAAAVANDSLFNTIGSSFSDS